jgi:ubiquinol oxidase
MIQHHVPQNASDWIALKIVKAMRWMADTFFAKRYGNRAVVLETVAGVPGMVGGMLQHLKSLRRMEDDKGKIKTLLDEAENERMHLMTFIKITRPTKLERILVLIVQGIYFIFYALLYMISPRTCHRIVGYMEEEAVVSYTQYLKEVESGQIENVPAPQIAIDYWKLPPDTRLNDLIRVIRTDEEKHRDVNHHLADEGKR